MCFVARHARSQAIRKQLELALVGIACEDDEDVHPRSRVFCYLQLEHSEDLSMQ